MRINRQIKVELARVAYIQDQAEMVAGIKAIYPEADVIPIFVPRTDTECFLFRVDDTFVFGASGTESKRDILTDLMCALKPYRYGGERHYGFSSISESIYNKLLLAYISLSGGSSPIQIICLGHSLGGDIALGAADILKSMAPASAVTQITTWGCPNGWNKEAREGYQARHKNVLHIQNSWDMVTKLQGITTGRPWDGYHDKYLKQGGERGHSLSKYIANTKTV